MSRKLVLIITFAMVLTGMLVSATVSTEVSVGVKAGDWIEYTIAVTGNPPTTPYPTWMKIEILSVQETNVTAKLTMNMSDGTQDTQTASVDVATGSGGNIFVIPANLTVGDTFHVEHSSDPTISGVETRTYAGVSRTAVYSTGSNAGGISPPDATMSFYWDKATGVLVEISQSQADYTVSIKADWTNMWQTQPFRLPIDSSSAQTVFIVLIIIAIAGAATGTFFVIRRRKKPLEEVVPPQS